MNPLRMLMVEDSAGDVRLVREALKEAGVHVNLDVARDGVEALEYLDKVDRGLGPRPNVILLDLNLPRKNGREVLFEVKTSPTLRSIPVLVMTSSKADDDVNAAYALHANCYITKPVDLEDYMHVVRLIEQFWFFTVTLPQQFHSGSGSGEKEFTPAIPHQTASSAHLAGVRYSLY